MVPTIISKPLTLTWVDRWYPLHSKGCQWRWRCQKSQRHIGFGYVYWVLKPTLCTFFPLFLPTLGNDPQKYNHRVFLICSPISVPVLRWLESLPWTFRPYCVLVKVNIALPVPLYPVPFFQIPIECTFLLVPRVRISTFYTGVKDSFRSSTRSWHSCRQPPPIPFSGCSLTLRPNSIDVRYPPQSCEDVFPCLSFTKCEKSCHTRCW